MTRIITYNLRLNGRDSDDYYRTVAAFADHWLAGVLSDGDVCQIIARIRADRQKRGEPDRSDAEYAFEMLALGVLLRQHGGEAARLPGWWLRVQRWLVDWQVRWPAAEATLKQWRGWLNGLSVRFGGPPADREDVRRLIAWLRANGETAKAGRLEQWQRWLNSEPAKGAEVVAVSNALAADFAAAGAEALNSFTTGVECFLADCAPNYRARYDAAFVSRSRLEYHLGMLGTELLSRAYRARFLATRRRIVIVPPCLRAQPEEKCQAVATPLGARCGHCTPTCRVHQITRLGEKRGFEVYSIPDELRVFAAGTGRADVGVVGVACALTNWGGGWEMESAGVPAQGLLLDYVGCNLHWDEKGIPTDTNLRKLEEVVMGQKTLLEG
ncbi:MAG: DUF116 domain-containing protein [Chloroflexi bacterium]|nr:DUF116 domain-containing protein [Chloroflexota bacterium]